jgi:hypothetical protein
VYKIKDINKEIYKEAYKNSLFREGMILAERDIGFIGFNLDDVLFCEHDREVQLPNECMIFGHTTTRYSGFLRFFFVDIMAHRNASIEDVRFNKFWYIALLQTGMDSNDLIETIQFEQWYNTGNESNKFELITNIILETESLKDQIKDHLQTLERY